MNTLRATFGARVRYLRELAQPALSQRALDALADLHPGHVWQIEQGERDNTTAKTAVGIARVFGVSLDWLIAGAGPDPDVSTVIAAASAARDSKALAATELEAAAVA